MILIEEPLEKKGKVLNKEKIKLDKKEVRQMRVSISKIEKRLERYQRKTSEIDQELNSRDAYKKNTEINVQSLLRDKMDIAEQIENLEEEWFELNNKIEER